MRLSLIPEPHQESLSEVIELTSELRREAEACRNDERRAYLLHEIALLEEQAGDDHAAARDWLIAVNAASGFREPLEKLLSLMQRRRSFQNLGKLTDRLARLGQGNDDLVRIHLLRGDILTDSGGDAEGARSAYESALNLDPRNVYAWLALQALASKYVDPKTEERTLAARVELAEDANYRAILRLVLSDVQRQRARVDVAIETLERVTTPDRDVNRAALQRLERLAQESANHALLLRINEQRFSDACDALASIPADGGIDGELTSELAGALDAALRAALLHQTVSGAGRRVEWLSSAAARLGSTLTGNPTVEEAATVLRGSAQWAAAASQSPAQNRSNAEAATTPEQTRPALLLHAALQASQSGQRETAIDVLQHALAANPSDIATRGTLFHLLHSERQWAPLGTQYLETVELFDVREDGVRHCFLAAFFATLGGDAETAQSALARAENRGATPAVLARFGRSLASFAGRERAYYDFTERLSHSGTAEEVTGARFELVRRAWLTPGDASLAGHLAAQEKAPHGEWLASTLLAYAQNVDFSSGQLALLKLARRYEPDMARAWMQLAAYRDVLRGSGEDAARWLLQLHEQQPDSVLISVQGATVLARLSRFEEAAQVLGKTASLTRDTDNAGLIWLESGILQWKAGRKTDAALHFKQAAKSGSPLAHAFAYCALCFTQPNERDTRRSTLEQELELYSDASDTALHRLVLNLSVEPMEPAPARSKLVSSTGLNSAATDALQLARALLPTTIAELAASDWLESARVPGEHVLRAAAFYESITRESFIDDPGSSSAPSVVDASAVKNAVTASSARAWAELGSFAAATELLGLAVTGVAPELLSEAYGRLSPHLEGEALDALEAQRILTFQDPSLAPARGAYTKLAHLECAAPGVNPEGRAHALEAAAAWLGPEDSQTAQALAAYNLLASGEQERALASFRTLTIELPDAPFAWQGLLTAALLHGDFDAQAEAQMNLGQLASDPAQASKEFGQAARLFLEELGNLELGRVTLQRAVDLDVGDAWIVDQQARFLERDERHPELLELLNRRLAHEPPASERLGILWQMAKASLALSQLDAAFAQALQVKGLEPEHAGAHALMAEVHLERGAYAEAASELLRLATLPSPNRAQRLESALAAVDILLTRLGDPQEAARQVAVLGNSGMDTTELRERLARFAAQSGDWEQAGALLASLMHDRSSETGRLDAARLTLAVYRDQLVPERALAAVEYLLEHKPNDAEAIDLLLSAVFPRAKSLALAERARIGLCDSLSQTPTIEGLARLARVAEFLEDHQLRQATLGSLISLGASSAEVLGELDELDFHARVKFERALTETELAVFADPAVLGPLSEVMQLASTELSDLLGPNFKLLGIGRSNRRTAEDAPELHSYVAQFARCFGLGPFELYVGGKLGPLQIASISNTTPISLVLGAGVEPSVDANLMGRLAAHTFAAATGRSMLLTHEPEDVAAFLVGLFHACDLPACDAASESSKEFELLLRKHLSKKLRKQLTAPLRAAVDAKQSESHWAELARASLDRAALLGAGDVSRVLRPGDRETPLDSQFSDPRMLEMVKFSVSRPYLDLRRELSARRVVVSEAQS